MTNLLENCFSRWHCGWLKIASAFLISFGSYVAPSNLLLAQESTGAAKRSVRITVNAPYVKTSLVTKQYVTNFVAYPYPVRPPRKKRENPSLPDPDSKPGLMRLKSLIQDISYNSRTIPEQPYPSGGLRFRFAYQKALQKSGLAEPHSLIELYPFVNHILPYVTPEVRRYNQLEAERTRRYEIQVKEFEENRHDIETQAMEQGFYPVEFVMNKMDKRFGYAMLAPGTWWIAGTVKVLTLTYHWQLPVRVKQGADETVHLNPENAILIEGGW